MAAITSIRYIDQTGRTRLAAQAELGVGVGVVGATPDRKARAGERDISLLMGENAEQIAQAHGLCTERFRADLCTEGLDYADLRVGTTLKIGACELEITRVGKRCFDDCPLQQKGVTCPLPRSVAFARVRAGGAVACGDGIEIG